MEPLRRTLPSNVPLTVARQWSEELRLAITRVNERRFSEALDISARHTALAGLYDLNTLAAVTHGVSGAARLGLLDYPAALRSLLESRRVYEAIGDHDGVSRAAINLSNLYTTIQAAPEAANLAELAAPAAASMPRPDRIRVEAQRARLLARTAEGAAAGTGAVARLQSLAQLAEREGEPLLAAELWNTAGYELFARGDPAGAETALRRALLAGWTTAGSLLPGVRRNIALLRADQGRPAKALRLTDRARQTRGGGPDWLLEQVRARALAATGRTGEALDGLRAAFREIRAFRLDRAPTAIRSSGAVSIKDLYDAFLAIALDQPDAALGGPLTAEMLETAGASQAFSLRESRGRNESAAYWEVVARLQRAYGDPSPQAVREVGLLRARLTELERAPAGASGASGGETWSAWRNRLSEHDAVIVFHSAFGKMLRFTGSRRGLTVSVIGLRQEITDLTARARRTLESGAGGPETGQLSTVLFRDLPPAALRAGRWLIVADGALYRLPFAALPGPDGRPLVLDRSIRLLPGLWMLDGEPARSWHGPVLAVGDPVYNAADPRHRGATPDPAREAQLPRLPGSAAEVRRCAPPPSIVLLGADATPERLAREFEHLPRVVHLAAHVRSSPSQPAESLLSLSVDRQGQPSHITAEWIAARELRPSLVVMSACRSGEGTVRPGEGLMGLTRAWIAAGTQSVIATHWPVADDNGWLLDRFYSHWRDLGERRPEEALRRAQADAIAGGGWRAAPSYWGGLFVIGRHEPD